jgi:hypothetical protein
MSWRDIPLPFWLAKHILDWKLRRKVKVIERELAREAAQLSL